MGRRNIQSLVVEGVLPHPSLLPWIPRLVSRARASQVAPVVKNPPANADRCKRCGFTSLGWDNPLEEGTSTLSSIIAWRIPWTERRGLVGYGP